MLNRIGFRQFNHPLPLRCNLESIKIQLFEIKTTKLKNNLSFSKVIAIAELQTNSDINLKQADKGTTVLMNKTDQIDEALVQLKNREHYQPLKIPVVRERHKRELTTLSLCFIGAST